MTTRAQWIKAYHEACKGYDVPTLDSHPTWLIELGARYGRLKATGGLKTETEHRMHKACTALDELGVKAISDVWTLMVVHEIADAKAARRKAPEPPKQAVAKRPTAAGKVLELLRERPVRSDAQIIEAVNAHTFSDGFSRVQLAWYKSRFRQGRLKGQSGPESIQDAPGGRGAQQEPKQAKPARQKSILEPTA